MNTIKFCLHCGAAIGAEEKFCSGCGANVAEMEATQNGAAAAAAPVTPAAPVEAAPQAQPVNNAVPPVQQPYNPAPNPAYAAPTAAAAAKPNPLKPILDKVKAKPIIAIIPAVILVALIVGIIILCNILKYQVIDAKDLCSIKFSGVNSAGTCAVTIGKYDDYAYSLDSDRYESAISDFHYYADPENAATDEAKLKDEPDVSPYLTLYKDNLTAAFTKAGDYSEAKKMRAALLNTKADLKIKVGKADSLSNGDKVTVTVKYDEEYLKDKNIKLKNTEFEVEVKGLKDGEKYDLFGNLEITFEGNDGEGHPIVNYKNDDYTVSYDYDYASNLTNGAKFTVTASLNANYTKVSDKGDAVWFEKDGKYYTVDSATATKEVTVEGLKELTEIDAFENLAFTYNNASPFISIEIDKTACSSQVKEYVNFYCEDEDLKIGDTFTIKAYAYGLSDNGYKLKGTPDEDGYYTKEYTVEDTAPVYADENNVSQILDAKKGDFSAQLSKIKSDNKGSSYFNGLDFDGSIESFGEFKVEKTYYISTTAEKASNIGYGEYENLVGYLYSSSIKSDEKDTATFAMVMLFGNNYIDNGTVKGNDDPEIKYFETVKDAEEFIKGLATDYNVSEINAAAQTTTTTAAAAETTTTTTTKAEATTTKKAAETTTTTLVP